MLMIEIEIISCHLTGSSYQWRPNGLVDLKLRRLCTNRPAAMGADACLAWLLAASLPAGYDDDTTTVYTISPEVSGR